MTGVTLIFPPPHWAGHMKPNFETLAVLFLAVLAIELRAGAQPPPPPVDYQTPPGVLTPGVSNPPVSPETPSAALAPSEYYGEDDSACYEGGNGWDAPYLGRRRGLGLRRWLGNRSGSAKLSAGPILRR